MRRFVPIAVLLASCSSGKSSTKEGPAATIAELQAVAPFLRGVATRKLPVQALVVALPTRGRSPLTIARHDDEGFSVSVSMPDARDVAATTIDGVTLLREIADQTDLAVATDGGRVEDLTVLRGSASRTLVRVLSFGPRVASARVRDGRIELLDESGRVGLSTDDVVAIDAKGTRAVLTPRLDGNRLTLEVPSSLVAPVTVDPMWTVVASMKTIRARATGVALPSGKVLVVGGADGAGGAGGTELTTAEVYDPNLNTWTYTANNPSGTYHVPASHAVTGSKVLIVGTVSTIYDATTNTFASAGTVNSQYSRAVTLTDGRVFVTGGSGTTPPNTRIWNPTTGVWTNVANDTVPRSAPIAFRLADGKVLVAGGMSPSFAYESSAEIYDPTANTWASAPSLVTTRSGAAIVSFATGAVVMFGGFNGLGDVRVPEVFNPTTRAWSTVGAGFGSYFTPGAPLPGDRALIAEGFGSVVFDLATGTASPTDSPKAAGGQPIAVPISGGRVLVAGGDTSSGVTSGAEIFQLGALGDTCNGDVSCVSRTCAFPNPFTTFGGVCCTSRCTGECETCVGTGGTCTGLTDVPPKTFLACGAYQCGGGACRTSCTTNTHCGFMSFCSGGACVPKKDPGETCAAAGDCKSNFCVDGVCCSSACTDQCSACDVPGSLGTCRAVRGAPHGARTACGGVGLGTDCAKSCDGTVTTTCSYPGSAAPCGSYACSAGVETHVARCNGAGACTDVATSCGAYACDASACKSICATATDCAAGYRCVAGACVPREGLGKACDDASSCTTAGCVDGVCCGEASCPPGSGCAAVGAEGRCTKNRGTACANDAECGSKTCVDGVCCDTRCTGNCEACDVPGHFGTCFPVKGAPHGMRPACKSDSTAPCADEVCDGTDVTKCGGFVGPETACRAASCESGRALPPATCDGKGGCPAATEVSCGGFTCDDAKLACRTTCRSAKDCLDGFDCRENACVPKSATCSKDLLTVVGVDGAITECSPFVCKGGKCLDACTTSNDCVAGRICDPGAKTCIERAAPAAAEEGGCSASPRGPRASLALVMLTLAVLVARRRSRGLLAAAALIGCSSREVAPAPPAVTIVAEVRSFGFGNSRLQPTIDVRFASRANAPTILRDDEVSVSIAAVDLGPVAFSEADGDRVFAAAAPDVDVVHLARGSSFEDVRVLRTSRASSTARYRIESTLAKRLRDGRFELIDGERVRFVADRPFAIDKQGTRRDARMSWDGEVLTVALDTAGLAYPIALDPTWSTVSPLATARFEHSHAASGSKVLVVGGRNSTGAPVSTAEIYDATTNTWKTTAPLAASAINTVLTALTDGRIADVGTRQVYDPVADAWTLMPAFPSTRQNPFAIGLADGRLLIAGGVDGAGADLKTALIYDATAKTYTAAGAMGFARNYSAGVQRVVLSDGRVIVAGGDVGSTMERFDPVAKTWTTLAALPLDVETVSLLPDGRLLGTSQLNVKAYYYSTSTGSWAAAPDAPFAPWGTRRLSDGTLFTWSGGQDKVALFDQARGGWLPAGPFAAIGFSRYAWTATPIAGGAVVLVGGRDASTVYNQVFVWRRMANGSACTERGECQTGECVDGYCCNTACTAGCSACNVGGSLGTCSPVTGAPVGGRTGCSPYLTCTAGACASTCASDTQCVSTHWCDGTSKCTAKAANGGACTTARGCISGNCVDGVCCNTPCGDQCAACNEPGKLGTCSPVSGPPRGSRAACAGFGFGTTCGIRCDGTTTATCTYPTAATACGANACADSIETHTASCNGLGKCSDTPKSCGAYGCGVTACNMSCTVSGDCAKGFFCMGGACVPAAGLGKPCSAGDTCATGNCVDGVCCATSSCSAGSTCAHPGRKGTCAKSDATTCASDAECGSGACVDGVCCEARCDGKCQACDVVGQLGRCAPVTGAPHGARGACPSDPANACQGSSCDGKDTTKCATLAGPEISCRSASCDKGVATLPGSCNGSGSCPAVITSSCDGYACDPATSGCRTTCSAGTDCEGGYLCRAGKCEPATSTCSADALSVLSVDGTSQTCAPYVCRDNGCLTACVSSADCVTGTLCDPTSKTCAAASAPAGDDGGGCTYGARQSNVAAALLVMLGLAASRRRRR